MAANTKWRSDYDGSSDIEGIVDPIGSCDDCGVDIWDGDFGRLCPECFYRDEETEL